MELVGMIREDNPEVRSKLTLCDDAYRTIITIVRKSGLTPGDVADDLADAHCPGQIISDLTNFDTLEGRKIMAYMVAVLNDHTLSEAMRDVIKVHDDLRDGMDAMEEVVESEYVLRQVAVTGLKLLLARKGIDIESLPTDEVNKLIAARVAKMRKSNN